ncbi:MAG: type II secretion system protein [Methylophilus sp.]
MQNGNTSLMNTLSNKHSGYILIGLLVLIMVSGFALAQVGAKWSDARKREREQELLKIGDTIRKAIGNYYNHTPGIVKQYPPNLEALLRDERFPKPQRYLRKLYIDPMTQREGWGIIEAPSGGVMGVYSLSDAKPFKTKNFRPVYLHFEDKKYYGEWYFIYVSNSY